MNGRVVRFDDSAHRAADAVLPWFVNGTLGEAEASVVERHVRECQRCQREVDLLKQLQLLCEFGEPAPDPTPAYRRLAQRIHGRWRLAGLPERWRNFARRWQEAPGWARWAIAVQFVGMVAVVAWVAPPGSETGAQYRTLGAPVVRAADIGTIAVVFRPDVVESGLRRIVRDAGARVIDGPTASDAWLLQVPAGRLGDVLAALRADPAVVLAQPLTTGPGR